MFFCTTSSLRITLMAYSGLDWPFLVPRKTFPKAPLLMGLRMWKSSMVGASDVEETVLFILRSLTFSAHGVTGIN